MIDRQIDRQIDGQLDRLTNRDYGTESVSRGTEYLRMNFLNWFWGFWNQISNLAKGAKESISGNVNSTDSSGCDPAVEIHKISVLYISNKPLNRNKVLSDCVHNTSEHFGKTNKYSELAGCS